MMELQELIQRLIEIEDGYGNIDVGVEMGGMNKEVAKVRVETLPNGERVVITTDWI